MKKVNLDTLLGPQPEQARNQLEPIYGDTIHSRIINTIRTRETSP